MNITIGIITHNRPNQLYRLLYSLQPQLKSNHRVVIVENGSDTIKKTAVDKLKIKRYSLIKKNFAQIPKARNIILKQSIKQSDLLIFIDDDCLVSSNWLKEYEELFDKNKNIKAVQGKIKSIPTNNVYAQTSQLLFQLWFQANTKQLTKHHFTTKIIDTKNVALRTSILKTSQFNEIQQFATDIQLAYQLNQQQITIHYFQSSLVFHQERTSFKSFILHRVRLSSSYRLVNKKAQNYFNSVSFFNKLNYLNRQLKFSNFIKIKVIIALLLAYTLVFLKSIPQFAGQSKP